METEAGEDTEGVTEATSKGDVEARTIKEDEEASKEKKDQPKLFVTIASAKDTMPINAT